MRLCSDGSLVSRCGDDVLSYNMTAAANQASSGHVLRQHIIAAEDKTKITGRPWSRGCRISGGFER